MRVRVRVRVRVRARAPQHLGANLSLLLPLLLLPSPPLGLVPRASGRCSWLARADDGETQAWCCLSFGAGGAGALATW